MANQPGMQMVPSSPPLFTSYHNRGFEGVVVDEHQHATQPVSLAPQNDFLNIQQTQLELAPSMAQQRNSYPYSDPYYGNLVTYGTQAMIPAQLMSIQQARMPLPSELLEEEPVYVNAKQYHGILRRRQSRAKAEMENKVIKSRKPYLHESRHKHALRRARGCGGRFLNTKSKEDGKEQSNQSSPSPRAKSAGKGLTKSGSQTSSDNTINTSTVSAKSLKVNSSVTSALGTTAHLLSNTTLQLSPNSNSLSSQAFDIQNSQTNQAYSLPVSHVFPRHSNSAFDPQSSQLFVSQTGASGFDDQVQNQPHSQAQLFDQENGQSFEPQTQALISDSLNQELSVNHVYHGVQNPSMGLSFSNHFLSSPGNDTSQQLSSGLQFHTSAFHPISNNGDIVNVVPGSLHDFKN